MMGEEYPKTFAKKVRQTIIMILSRMPMNFTWAQDGDLSSRPYAPLKVPKTHK